MQPASAALLRAAYALVTWLLVPFLLLHLAWRALRVPGYRRGWQQRFGFGLPRPPRPAIWVHAVSVGEVQASASLVRELLDRHPGVPVVVTTMTPTGAERARALFGDRVLHAFVPYDLAGAVRRFMDQVQPALALILETELWPNLWNECGRRRIPLVLSSARVSLRSVRWYRRLTPLFREVLSHGVVIAAQTPADAGRFRLLGAAPERTHVTGNIKFDFELPPGVAQRGADFRATQAGGRPIWVAASTHEGEEEQVLAAHREVCARVPGALLLLVPRHPQRFAAVGELAQRLGFGLVTRSSGSVADAGTEVFVCDSMGELTTFYAAADVAFVGGSLVPIGGHNLLEPAALALPLVTGPHNENAADIAALMAGCGALQVIPDAAALAAAVTVLLGDPGERQRRGQAGQAALDANRGALARLLGLVDPLVR
ncbi:MAG: lipid IV(A) 3-deoxy-D-manno-octulosonic acid transferase [Chromatiales bacterium]|jgi:3-deoxy-D-manno-octulosonic-acid transferase|nr:lipid IV(A) 3-deoxy-D-manno-octulosonic acid transferase [Chromatiales bacterium]